MASGFKEGDLVIIKAAPIRGPVGWHNLESMNKLIGCSGEIWFSGLVDTISVVVHTSIRGCVASDPSVIVDEELFVFSPDDLELIL